MSELNNLPQQQLPFSQKTREWRKKHLDWAESKTFFNYSLVRRSILHKRINYDLLNGKIHMGDLELILNPENISAGFIPDKIQHYPIMNSKINVLRGEELQRVFDYKVVVTNPNAIAEIEENKKNELFGRLQQIISDTSTSEEEFNAELEKLNNYYTYSWQDLREVRANALLNHYIKEYNIPLKFNAGFIDAMTVGEEIYQCDIVGGEPVIERLNPLKVRIFKSGYSNRIEDADIIIIEDYWSTGKVIDTYYDVLTNNDIKYLESIPTYESTYDGTDNYDERDNFILSDFVDGAIGESLFLDAYSLFGGTGIGNHMFYDMAGNVRVLKVFWKSRRKIKKVKSYDPETGEEVYSFYPETYNIDKSRGEEETTFWINEAWEGTKIGAKIYVNMRPRIVQYNRLSNPSECHFGIIGSIYNLNEQRPFSLVDMMKPYNYLYDVIHDRLNKAIAANWGKLVEMDLAQVPAGWDVEKWMYYAKVNHLLIKDSFKEGNIGPAKGKLAGNFASNSRGVIDADTGNYIQQHINLLEFIKMEMSEVAGISKQREGQIASRETVGGVERSVLQSASITSWIFSLHDDVKRRALECFLETAKAALKGRNKKFQYILSDMSIKLIDIDGDEFAEADYGLVVDNSNSTQQLNSNIETLAQAALQNQTLSFSTIMKLYTSTSISEKIKLVERDEQESAERASQAQQQQLQIQQQLAQQQLQAKENELSQKDQMNMRDNETKLLIAQMNRYAEEEANDEIEYSEKDKRELEEKIREFDAKLKLERDKLDFNKKKHSDEIVLEKSKFKAKSTK